MDQATERATTHIARPSPVPFGAQTLSSIQLDLLRTAPLKNEEVIELLAFLCNAESIDPYIDHVTVLRDRYDMTVEIRPLAIEVLSLRDKFNDRQLRNFYIGIGDVGYHGLVPKVITLYQQDKSAGVYLQRLETAFGIQPDVMFIQSVIKFIDDSDMEGPGIEAVRHLFQSKLDRVAEYAPIPKYIRDFDIQVNQLPRLKEETELTEDLPADVIAAKLINQLDAYVDAIGTLPKDEAKEVLVERIEKMSEAEKKAFVDLFKVDPEEVKRIRQNRDVFRVYGPSNPMSDLNFANLRKEPVIEFDASGIMRVVQEGELDIDLIMGGNRMFIDMRIVEEDDDGIPLDDWFRGFCLQCNKRIRAYFHAVREPFIKGGWRGCYCSWDCVRQFIKLDTESDPDRYNTYVAHIALTREFEQEMGEIGIADRDIEEEEEDEDEEGNTRDRYEGNQDVVDELIRNAPKINMAEIPVVTTIPKEYGDKPF